MAIGREAQRVSPGEIEHDNPEEIRLAAAMAYFLGQPSNPAVGDDFLP
jgi:hypothetical protein